MGNFAELENKLWAESNENYLLYVKKIWKAYNRYERFWAAVSLVLLPIALPVGIILLIQRKIEA